MVHWMHSKFKNNNNFIDFSFDEMSLLMLFSGLK